MNESKPWDIAMERRPSWPFDHELIELLKLAQRVLGYVVRQLIFSVAQARPSTRHPLGCIVFPLEYDGLSRHATDCQTAHGTDGETTDNALAVPHAFEGSTEPAHYKWSFATTLFPVFPERIPPKLVFSPFPCSAPTPSAASSVC
jgi:hypothetical protein